MYLINTLINITMNIRDIVRGVLYRSGRGYYQTYRSHLWKISSVKHSFNTTDTSVNHSTVEKAILLF